jgi:hypothetical protein
MSKLLNSKTFKVGGLVIAVAMMLSVAAVSASAATTTTTTTTVVASAYTYSGVMKAGSKGPGVSTLQAALNSVQTLQVVVDGKFGPATKAAVMSFQMSHGLVADGVVGPKTGAALTSATVAVITIPSNFPAGCTSNVGFSSTTGQSCAVSMTLPAGCTSSSGFSTTTGMSCGSSSSLPAGCMSSSGFSSTTGVSCSGGSASSGTNGYLADISLDSSNRVSTVYESETDKVVAGIRMTARLSDQTVDRIRVTFCNDTVGGGVCSNTTSSSANLAKYISSASLWYGSTKLQTIAIANADRGTSNDIYTFNFSSLGARILKDQVGRFYVSVNANGSLDTNDANTANFTVKFLAGGISASSPDGSFDTYPSADLEQSGLLFGKFSSSGVKATVSLSTNNPVATTLAVNNTSATNGVTLLKFTIKATNSDLTLRKVPIQVVTTGDPVASVVNTIKLYKGTTLLDSQDGSAGVGVNTALNTPVTGYPSGAINNAAGCTTTCGFVFSNLSSPDNKITSGMTNDYSVVVDIKAQSNFTAGDTIKASLQNADVLLSSNFSVQDTNGDQLPANSSVRVGSAVGEVMTLLVNGLNVVKGSETITTTTDTNGKITSATYRIPLAVTSFGQTLYTGQSAQLATSVSGTNAFAYALNTSAAPSTDIVACTGCTITSSLSSDAAIEGSGFRLDSGTTKNYILTVNLTGTVGSAPGFYRVHVEQAKSFTDNALTAGASVQTLLPVQNFQTAYQKID